MFPDLTITRVGSNALLRFIAGTRDIILDSGTLLFSSSKGAEGYKVQAGATTAAAATGSNFLIGIYPGGRVEVIGLSEKVLVYFTANPKNRVVLRAGQMVDITAGAKKMPPVVTINLKVLLATSLLLNDPFPGRAIIARNAERQVGIVGPLLGRAFVAANEPLLGNVTLPQAAQTARRSSAAPPAPPPREEPPPAPRPPPPSAPPPLPSAPRPLPSTPDTEPIPD